jgi:hypothetical protein
MDPLIDRLVDVLIEAYMDLPVQKKEGALGMKMIVVLRAVPLTLIRDYQDRGKALKQRLENVCKVPS